MLRLELRQSQSSRKFEVYQLYKVDNYQSQTSANLPDKIFFSTQMTSLLPPARNHCSKKNLISRDLNCAKLFAQHQY